MVWGTPLTLALSVHEPECLSPGFIICEPPDLEFYFQSCLPVAPFGTLVAAAAKASGKCASLQRNDTHKWAGV